MRSTKPVLSVDFDGTLSNYASGWQGVGVVADDPVPGAIAWIITTLPHYRICIFSSRSKSLRGRHAMKQWLFGHLRRYYFTPEMEDERTEFEALHGEPSTGCDAEELASIWAARVLKQLRFPWFKPPAYLTIDDRALTFTGDFGDFGLRQLKLFRPWNKKVVVTDEQPAAK